MRLCLADPLANETTEVTEAELMASPGPDAFWTAHSIVTR
jgi:hypothetical protein